MTLRPSGRLVVSTANDGAFCAVQIGQIDIINVRIGGVGCCIVKDNFCFGQNTDVTLRFTAPASNDFSGASEIYFTIYSDANLTTQVLQKTLTDGDITQPTDNTINVPLSSTDTALTAVRRFWEVAMVTGGGLQKVLGQGIVRVEETGAFNA